MKHHNVFPAPPCREFRQLFSSTRRGARLARLLAAERLAAWGWPYDSDVSRTASLIVGELAANAVLHGQRPGRDFRLRLTVSAADLDPGPGPGPGMSRTLRIEVSDAYGERRPAPDPKPADPDAEAGRGLLLVEALATRWGVADRPPSGKTVWAALALRPGAQEP